MKKGTNMKKKKRKINNILLVDKRVDKAVLSVSTELVLLDKQITSSILESITSLRPKTKNKKRDNHLLNLFQEGNHEFD
jgi:hypothetical protein